MKMRNLMLGALALGFGGGLNCGIIDVTVDVDVEVYVQDCLGAHSTCSIVRGGRTNAIGDVSIIDIRHEPITPLMPVKKEGERIELDLPKVGELKVYSFVPTEGELAGTRVYVALNNILQRGRLAGQTFIRVLRQLEGEKPDQWIEAGAFILKGAKAQALKKMSFFASPNGTFVLKDYKGVDKVVFYLGDKILRTKGVQKEETQPKA